MFSICQCQTGNFISDNVFENVFSNYVAKIPVENVREYRDKWRAARQQAKSEDIVRRLNKPKPNCAVHLMLCSGFCILPPVRIHARTHLHHRWIPALRMVLDSSAIRVLHSVRFNRKVHQQNVATQVSSRARARRLMNVIHYLDRFQDTCKDICSNSTLDFGHNGVLKLLPGVLKLSHTSNF